MFKKVSNIIAITLVALFVSHFSLYANDQTTNNEHGNLHHPVKKQIVNNSQRTRSKDNSDSFIIIFILCVVFFVYYLKYYLPKKQKRDFFNKIQELIEEHEIALSGERDKTITRDAYGNIFDDKWKKKEIPHFIEHVIKKRLSGRELDILKDEKNEVIEMIDTSARDKTLLISQEFKYNDSFSGIEYESFCKNLLLKTGWDVETTPIQDQGVDIIAIKQNIKVAIQCKKYSNNVGNKAVQEIHTGKEYYRANYGVVVSNFSYTKSAIELASSINIKLLHHNQLLKDDFYK